MSGRLPDTGIVVALSDRLAQCPSVIASRLPSYGHASTSAGKLTPRTAPSQGTMPNQCPRDAMNPLPLVLSTCM